MNAWARHYTDALTAALEDGETLLGANRVTVVSASKVEVPDRSAVTRPGQPPVRRRGRKAPALVVARAHGFALPSLIFILGVSNRRLLIWKSSPLLAKPKELAASYPLSHIASIRRHRRLGPTRASIVLDDGALVVVQALWSRHLGDLATAFTAARQ
jgi:hypothetical protein